MCSETVGTMKPTTKTVLLKAFTNVPTRLVATLVAKSALNISPSWLFT